MAATYISSVEAAKIAGISRRAALKALSRAQAGISWRGHALEVRRTYGRGGRSGISYEVSLRSLSEALAQPLSDDSVDRYFPTPAPATWRSTAGDQGPTVAARLIVIEEAVQHPPRSPERSAAIAEAVKRGTPERTVRNWIKAYEAHGGNGLARKKPAGAGQARIVISQVFDREFRTRGYPEAQLLQLGAMVEQLRKDIWASPTQGTGEPEVRRHLEHGLWKLCGQLGLDMPESALRVSRRFNEQDRAYSHVDVWKHDAKRFADGAPHVVRDLTRGAPMLHVVADVKHLDLVLRRDDGSEAWPKIIAFQDRSTQRVFAYPLLLPVGEGVRGEHVVQAFIEMASDPSWGFPQSLHLDNGSEFSCFEAIRGAFQLVNEEARKEIIYSIPYNAKAKTVEGWFSRADQYLFKVFPGYAGRERMNKKTHKAGRPTEPYPHDWPRFCEQLQAGVAYINSRPIGGQWAGKSADEWFRDKATRMSWKPVMAAPLLLDAAFCKRDTLRVDRGGLKWKGMRYTHELLHGIATRTQLDVAISWRRGSPILFRAPGGGWQYANAEVRLDADDIEGARESGRRRGRHLKAVKALAKSTAPYDPLAAVEEMAQRHKPRALTGRPDQLGGDGALIEMAAGKLVAERDQAALPSAKDIERRREEAETRRLEKRFGRAC